MPTSRIQNIKDFIGFNLDINNIEYEVIYQEDPDSGGYVYSISTENGMVIFSDSGNDNEITMFKFNKKMYDWGEREGLSAEQMLNLKLYTPVQFISELIEYLSNG